MALRSNFLEASYRVREADMMMATVSLEKYMSHHPAKLKMDEIQDLDSAFGEFDAAQLSAAVACGLFILCQANENVIKANLERPDGGMAAGGYGF